MFLRVNCDLGLIFLIVPQTHILSILKDILCGNTPKKLLIVLHNINMDFVHIALFWVI